VLDKVELDAEPGLANDEAAASPPASAPEPKPWRQEVSEKVQNFQRRRARLRSGAPPEENFDLELKGRGEPEPLPSGPEKMLEFPLDAAPPDAQLPSSLLTQDEEPPAQEQIPEEEERGILAAGGARGSEPAVAPASPPKGPPLELVMGPPDSEAPPFYPLEMLPLLVAPLGSRFAASLLDALILLLSGALFGLIFRKAGGHLSPVPPELAVVVIITAIFVFGYFGLFTALSYTTPGLAWMGLEVRNMAGRPPLPGESCLRAFGYLVSLAAFLVGFFWAAVDSETLTWHDRISGTFVTPASAVRE
jgi:uncharacterized RDD family membrane protein YckC